MVSAMVVMVSETWMIRVDTAATIFHELTCYGEMMIAALAGPLIQHVSSSHITIPSDRRLQNTLLD